MLSSYIKARVLRLLATEHIFKEVTPDVFANNRISSLLDTGNSIDKLIERREVYVLFSKIILISSFASPQCKLDGGVGIAAFVSHT